MSKARSRYIVSFARSDIRIRIAVVYNDTRVWYAVMIRDLDTSFCYYKRYDPCHVRIESDMSDNKRDATQIKSF